MLVRLLARVLEYYKLTPHLQPVHSGWWVAVVAVGVQIYLVDGGV